MVRVAPAAFAALIATAAPEWQVLVEWAIGGAGTGTEERRVAAERVVTVLAGIPEAATRDLYIQEAARRLELSPSALAADVGRAIATGGRKPIRLSAPPTPPPAAIGATEAGEAGLDEEDAGASSALVGGVPGHLCRPAARARAADGRGDGAGPR